MPNLLPDWLPWIHPAGRLIWASLITLVGIAFVIALIKPPMLKRPFPTRTGVALFFIVPIVGYVIAVLVPDDANLFDWPLDAIIVDLVIVVLVAHAMLMVLSREPRDPNAEVTWVEAFGGSIGVFALMVMAYAVVPHEWLTYANSYLPWGDSTNFIFRSSEDMLWILPWHWPFDFNFPALRDIVVTGIYIIFLGLNLKLWVMWQKRYEVREAPAPVEGAPARRSRFGRPLRAKA
jgi:amino acid transporter